MTELETRVIAAVAKEGGLPPLQVSLDSRLELDLGMTGDDAVDFFLAFEKDFSVDLAPLYANWNCYFGPEAPFFRGSLLLVLGIGFAAAFLRWRFPSIPTLVVIVVLAALASFICRRALSRSSLNPLPITVKDLVDAAEAGRWTKEVPQATDRP